MTKETPKSTPVKRKAPVKKPEIISYSIRMVIPTVAYGNIQPEIVVKANSLEEAHDFIVPHMNKLWKEYYLVDGKRPAATPKVTLTKPKDSMEKVIPTLEEMKSDKSSPISSVALVKATQAINSCRSMEAYELIVNQVRISVKLTDEDKQSLRPILKDKYLELKK